MVQANNVIYLKSSWKWINIRRECKDDSSFIFYVIDWLNWSFSVCGKKKAPYNVYTNSNVFPFDYEAFINIYFNLLMWTFKYRIRIKYRK
jgi:hypothetical protein